MGRPAMNLTAIIVRLPNGIAQQIDTLMGGTGKRAEFIRTAVRNELKRRKPPTKPAKAPHSYV